MINEKRIVLPNFNCIKNKKPPQEVAKSYSPWQINC